VLYLVDLVPHLIGIEARRKHRNNCDSTDGGLEQKVHDSFHIPVVLVFNTNWYKLQI
jgi:hypothetical protein